MQVTIRRLKEEDAYTSVNWRNDPEVFKYTVNTYDHTITIENELEWIRKVLANPNDYRCAIMVDNEYVGNIYLTDINDISADFHIFIGEKQYWEKGIAKRASLLIFEYASNVLGISHINLKVNRENNAAIQLYRALNFYEIEKDGGWIVMRTNLR